MALAAGVSLRRRVAPTVRGDELGLYASALTTAYRLTAATRFWDLARLVPQRVKKKLMRGDAELFAVKAPLRLAALRCWVPPNERGDRRFLRILNRLHPPASMISVVPRGESIAGDKGYGPFQLEAIHGLGASSRTPWFSMSTVSRRRLYWNFVYLEPCLSRKRAERIADRAVAHLTAATAK